MAEMIKVMDELGSYIKWQKQQEEFKIGEQKKMEETLDLIMPGWRDSYFRERYKLTPKDRQKIEQLLDETEQLKRSCHPLAKGVQKHTCQTQFIHRLKPVVFLWKSYKIPLDLYKTCG